MGVIFVQEVGRSVALRVGELTEGEFDTMHSRVLQSEYPGDLMFVVTGGPKVLVIDKQRKCEVMAKRWCLLVLLVLLVGCAPKTVPAPAPTPVSPPAQPTAATPVAPATVSPEDAAWAKVVEAARKEGSLVVYGVTFVGDVGQALTEALKKKYGLNVEIISGGGSAHIERLKTEKRMGGIVADIMESSGPNAVNAKVEGLLVSRLRELPVLREKAFDLLPQALDTEGYFLNYSQFFFSPYINTNLVKVGAEPKSWKELLGPGWKGKMSAPDPGVSNSLYIQFVPLMESHAVDSDYVEKLGRQDIALDAQLATNVTKLSRGEAYLTVSGNPLFAANFVKEGAPIRAIDMEEGSVLVTIVIEALKDSPHPNAAKVFLNWMLTQEGQTVFGKAAGLKSVRNDVTDFMPTVLQLRPKKPILLTNEFNDKIAKAFREKAWVQTFSRR